jgi:hypothetical protein
LTWDAAAFVGGAAIQDFRMNIAEQGRPFQVLDSGLLDTDYLVTGLTFGVTYEFKVESRNSYGYSDYSEVLTLLCAFKPDPPTVVSTANSNDLVTIDWNDPIDNGYVIHEYKVYILESDGVTFTQESVECDGISQAVIDNTECQVSLDTLKSAPYNLVQGDSVQAKVISVNIYGDSQESIIGSGALIQLVPEPPINLLNDPTTTTDVTIRFTWEDGLNEGGSPIIDYAVYSD